MSRLPPLRHDDLDPARRELWDSTVGTRDAAMTDADGGLSGPFNAFLHAPAVGRHLTGLGRAMHEVARQPAGAGRIGQDAYDAAHRLGDTGMVELVTLCGYYTLISFLLNGLDVRLPPGESPAWDGKAPGPA